MKSLMLTVVSVLMLNLACAQTNLVSFQGNDKKTILVLPAKKYTAEKPLFENLARAAENKDLNIIRFNWEFVTNGTEPSANFQRESAQVNEMIRHIHQDLGVSMENIYVVAKSFGSRVLMKSNFSQLKKVSLLTPNCSEQATFAQTYGEIFSTDTKINISISVDDPYCKVDQIYEFLGKRTSQVQIYTSVGDHNFDLESDPERLNQKAAVAQLINWVEHN